MGYYLSTLPVLTQVIEFQNVVLLLDPMLQAEYYSSMLLKAIMRAYVF
jgi:hypothetical protein